jgi:nucleoside-diphosphate-sugar epimerase
MPRAVVTGGAGFVGSHLCDRLLHDGWDVVCVDSLLTGDDANLSEARSHSSFSLMIVDVTEDLPVSGPVDAVLHLASPASPIDYARHPIETLRVGSLGTDRALELARRSGARFLLTSTSEVYGDPLVHPQLESYWGNVNPIGPRSCYDEAKRFSEALTMAYHRTHGLEVRIARIFNTYGPRMRRDDGRAVPSFIDQALADEPMTVHGDGSQTRSLCYVADLVEGLSRLLGSDVVGPVNLGNPEEVSVLDLAERVRGSIGSASSIAFTDRPTDDPQVRCPDIGMARRELGWLPKVSLDAGLARTVAWARKAWS